MGYKSTVIGAHPRANSLRTTIPIEICRMLNLQAGDVLEWAVRRGKDRKFIIVRKLQ